MSANITMCITHLSTHTHLILYRLSIFVSVSPNLSMTVLVKSFGGTFFVTEKHNMMFGI